MHSDARRWGLQLGGACQRLPHSVSGVMCALQLRLCVQCSVAGGTTTSTTSVSGSHSDAFRPQLLHTFFAWPSKQPSCSRKYCHQTLFTNKTMPGATCACRRQRRHGAQLDCVGGCFRAVGGPHGVLQRRLHPPSVGVPPPRDFSSRSSGGRRGRRWRRRWVIRGLLPALAPAEHAVGLPQPDRVQL